MTEDFLRYLHGKQVEGEGGGESHDARDESHDQDDEGGLGDDDEIPSQYISAESVV